MLGLAVLALVPIVLGQLRRLSKRWDLGEGTRDRQAEERDTRP
jgi:hypothetical protein